MPKGKTEESKSGKKTYVFRSRYPRLSVLWKGAPRDHITFRGAKTVTIDRETGDKREVTAGIFETTDAKLAKHLDENVKECWLVDTLDGTPEERKKIAREADEKSEAAASRE